MALNVGVICGMVAAAGLGALVVQAALITGTTGTAAPPPGSREKAVQLEEDHGNVMEIVDLKHVNLFLT